MLRLIAAAAAALAAERSETEDAACPGPAPRRREEEEGGVKQLKPQCLWLRYAASLEGVIRMLSSVGIDGVNM